MRLYSVSVQCFPIVSRHHARAHLLKNKSELEFQTESKHVPTAPLPLQTAECNWSWQWSCEVCVCGGLCKCSSIHWMTLVRPTAWVRPFSCLSVVWLSVPAVYSPHVSHALFGLSRWQVFALDGSASAACSTCNLQLAAYHLPPGDCSWRSSGLNLTFDCILIKK